MGYCRFLENLLEDGRVTVSEIAPISAEELEVGDEILRRFEGEYRLELPGTVPELQVAASRWAAVNVFRTCQFAVFRDEPVEAIDKELSHSIDNPITPEVHYSVDVVFRYLPDLMQFASSATDNDPLIGHLQRWACEWPLSSVGMSEIGEVRVDDIADHPALLQLYGDRVVATGDVSRLADARVRDAVQANLGMYPQLAPKIDAALKEYDVEETTP